VETHGSVPKRPPTQFGLSNPQLYVLLVGAGAWTARVFVAGVGSVFPAASVAATVNVCCPTGSPEYVFGLVQGVALPSSAQANVG
jgi:hypothetical protein